MQALQPYIFKQFLIDRLSRRQPKAIAAHNLRRAGVLVPVVQAGETYNFLFTTRTEIVETHKGQISFPGGVADTGDASMVDTALREAWEEVGIAQSTVDVIGVLDDLQTPTGFVITPVVGVIEHLSELSINAHEVAEVFQVPVGFFLNPTNGRRELRTVGGKDREVWYYDVDNRVIWGATAMIIRSFLTTVGLL